MKEKIKLTKEMSAYWLELQDIQNKRNKKNQDLQVEVNALEIKLREIGKAVIGFGSALNALNIEKEALEKEIKETKRDIDFTYTDNYAKFKNKYGYNYSDLEADGF